MRFLSSGTRQGDDWVRSIFNSLDDILRLKSIDCEIPLREIYDKVEISSQPAGV